MNSKPIHAKLAKDAKRRKKPATCGLDPAFRFLAGCSRNRCKCITDITLCITHVINEIDAKQP